MCTKEEEPVITELDYSQCKFLDVFGKSICIPPKHYKTVKMIHEGSNNISIRYSKEGIKLENNKRQCPYCNRYKAHIHEWKPRTLHFYTEQNVHVKVARYECVRCKRTYMADLTSIVNKSANFTHDFKKGLLHKLIETDSTLFQVKYDLQKNGKDIISHQSIENFLLEFAKPLDYDPLASRGYLLFDVQWIKMKKKWKYRFALYDLYQDQIIADKIYDHENSENIEAFLRKYTHNITVKCITTDLDKKYRPIIAKLGFNHQYCLFHAKKTINTYIGRKIRRLKKTMKNKADLVVKYFFNSNLEKFEKEYERYNHYKSEIKKYNELKYKLYEVLDNKDYIKSFELLNTIMVDLDQYKGQIKKFIKNRLRDQFRNFKLYTTDTNIAHTSNKIENYFSKTMSKKFKRKYRSNEGLLARIYLNEERYERNKKRRKYYPKTTTPTIF